MPRKSAQAKPTDTECTILSAIWARGSATVREVFEDLSSQREIGYTTVLKFMQIMTEKELLTRDTSVRPQVYSTTQSEQQTQKRLVRDLVDRAFAGSPGNLALQALSLAKVSPAELKQIRSLLNQPEDHK
ncbi:MAG: BlaI/MecI/CopY family transcriptional regulator [Phycisphaerales bacterium]|nr:BlaI/MecI/CopY family transcriptional regulator [Phycisphaerales bacterium]